VFVHEAIDETRWCRSQPRTRGKTVVPAPGESHSSLGCDSAIERSSRSSFRGSLAREVRNRSICVNAVSASRFGDKWSGAVDDVARHSNAFRYVTRREHHPQRNPCQAVRFRQTVRDDKGVAECRCRLWRGGRIVLCLCIDFIDHHQCANRRGHHTDLFEHVATGQGARSDCGAFDNTISLVAGVSAVRTT
jgi:hypothetical protein